MIAATLRQPIATIALGLTVVFHGTWARAADTSPWDADSQARMRLIAGSSMRAGVEIRLSPGWKTYWRYPGDSGVPPRFDFTGSQNVKSVEVAWPAPHAFTDDSGTSIGYKNGVIFPLRIVPDDPKRPVQIRLKLEYGVCEKYCALVNGAAELALAGEPSSLEGAIAKAEALVPKRAKLGDDAPLAIRTVRREAGTDHPRIIVDVATPDPGPVELFAEGPTPDWALPVPAPIEGAPAGLRRFAFALDGLPPGATASGARLTFTLVAGDRAIEVATQLD